MNKVDLVLSEPYCGWASIKVLSNDKSASYDRLSYISMPHIDIMNCLAAGIMFGQMSKLILVEGERILITVDADRGSVIIENSDLEELFRMDDADVRYAAKTLLESVEKNKQEWIEWNYPESAADYLQELQLLNDAMRKLRSAISA